MQLPEDEKNMQSTESAKKVRCALLPAFIIFLEEEIGATTHCAEDCRRAHSPE